MNDVYNNPQYYEIAFSFRDIPAEVSVFEESIKRFSRIPVKRMLEIGSGNSPHMEELIKRGYEYIGIDLSEAMLEYAQRKASAMGASVKLLRANMAAFSLETPVDFGYIMIGSLYLKNTAELTSHFDSIARVLRKGGLYFLDECIHFGKSSGGDESWDIERDGIRIKTTCSARVINSVEHTLEETITLEIDDHGQPKKIVEKNLKRGIYPQEFLIFISGRNDFEFVGWWNNWDLSKPLEGTEHINRAITIVRRA